MEPKLSKIRLPKEQRVGLSGPSHTGEPIDGKCCSCGYTGKEETKCPSRKDRTHCIHWWDSN